VLSWSSVHIQTINSPLNSPEFPKSKCRELQKNEIPSEKVDDHFEMDKPLAALGLETDIFQKKSQNDKMGLFCEDKNCPHIETRKLPSQFPTINEIK
jgi:hypothetical protein